MTSWPCNLVYFIWLSKGYLVFQLRLSISSRCSQLNFLGKKFLGDLDLALWPWLKNDYFSLHIYLCLIYHLQFGLSEQKGKVSKVSEIFCIIWRKLTKNVVFARYRASRYSDSKNSFRSGIQISRPFQRVITRLFSTKLTFKVILRSWRTLTSMMS